MTLHEDWKALKARIDGFAATAQLAMRAYGHHSHDTIGILSTLKREANNLNQRLTSFLKTFESQLSQECRSTIASHLATVKPDAISNPNSSEFTVFAVAGPFMILAAEVTQLLADTDQVIVLRSERAFLHLRRTIEASRIARSEWQSAFTDGEVSCEKLGATHLLLHGIYAFKVDAKGARTDLVMNEALDMRDVSRVADGLVLTEWKLVKKPSEAAAIAEAARTQCQFYNPAVAGIELRSYRYIVLVSEQGLQMPKDITAGGALYRHINIPVDPATPSAAARSNQQ